MKNVFSLLASRLIVPVLSTILVFVLARKLGPEGMGVYATVMAVTNLFMSASCIGIRNIIIREIGRDPSHARDYTANAAAVVLGLSLASYALLFGYARLGDYSSTIREGIVIAGLALFAYSVSFVIESTFIALGNNATILKGTLLQHGFRVATSAVVLMVGFGVPAVLVTFVLSNVLLLGHYLRASGDRAGVRFEWGFVRDRIIGALGTFAILDIVANVYAKLGLLALSRMASPSEVGVYSAANTLTQMILMVPANMALAIYPKFAASAGRVEESSAHYRTYLRRTVVLVIPILVLTWVHAPIVTHIFYGDRFAGSAELLRISLLAVLPYTASIGMSYVLLGTNRQRTEAVFVVANTLLSGVAFVLLIRAAGVTGAAIAAAASPVPLVLLQIVRLRRELLRGLRNGSALRGVGTILAWTACVVALSWAGVHWMLVTAVACLVYAPAVFYSPLLTRDERDRIAVMLRPESGRAGA